MDATSHKRSGKSDSERSDLPRWASVIKKKLNKAESKNRKERDEITSPGEEEFYLRTRAHRSLSSQIDQATETAMKCFVKPLVDSVWGFFGQTTPSFSDGLSKKASSTESLFVVEPVRHYDESAIPLAMLCGPPSSLDRDAWVRCMVDSFHEKIRSNQARTDERKQPALCWLKNIGSSVSNLNHCGPLLQEIIRQCVEQDKRSEKFRGIVSNGSVKKRLRRLPIDNILLHWARNTDSFDSIIVVLQESDEEGSSLSSLLTKSFIQSLGNLRSQWGLPVHAVLVPKGLSIGLKQQFPIDSSAQGTSGALVKNFYLPSSADLHDKIWEILLLERRLPFVLPIPILQCIRTAFGNCHISAVRSMQMVKTVFAARLQDQGSSAFGMHDKAFMKDEWRRLVWFYLDDESRQEVMGQGLIDDAALVRQWQAEETSIHTFLLLLEIIWRIFAGMSGRTQLSLLDLMERIGQPGAKTIASEIVQHSPSPLPTTEQTLQRLAIARRALLSWIETNSDRSREAIEFEKMVAGRSFDGALGEDGGLRSLLCRLDEIIVLIGESNREGESTNVEQVRNLLEQWFGDLIGRARNLFDSITTSFLGDNTERVVEELLPEHRRNNAGALLYPLESTKNFSTNPSCDLYSMIADFVVVSREEWFRLYKEANHVTSSGEEKLWWEFCLGVRQLLLLGFIQEKRNYANRSDVLYEKGALVWCSGE